MIKAMAFYSPLEHISWMAEKGKWQHANYLRRLFRKGQPQANKHLIILISSIKKLKEMEDLTAFQLAR